MANVFLNIQLDDKGAQKLVDALAGSLDKTDTAAKKTHSTFGGLESILQGVGQAIGQKLFAILESLGDHLLDVVVKGAQVANVELAFERLATAAGQNGQQIIARTREMTEGLVSDFDIMSNANKGLLLGLPITAESMGTLGQTAIALGQAMNVGPGQAMSDLITGLGRGSAMILDNLGITVSAEAAYKKYAASIHKTADELTDAEKKTAVYNAAMAAAKQRVEEVGGIHLTAAQQVQRARVAFDNMLDVVGKAIADSPALSALIGGLADIFGDLAQVVEENEGTIREWVNTAAVVAAEVLVTLAQGLHVLIDVWAVAKSAVHLVTMAIEVQITALVALARTIRDPLSAYENLLSVQIAARKETLAAAAAITQEVLAAAQRHAAADKVVKIFEALRDRVVNSTAATDRGTESGKRHGKSLEDQAESAKKLKEELKKLEHQNDINASAMDKSMAALEESERDLAMATAESIEGFDGQIAKLTAAADATIAKARADLEASEATGGALDLITMNTEAIIENTYQTYAAKRAALEMAEAKRLEAADTDLLLQADTALANAREHGAQTLETTIAAIRASTAAKIADIAQAIEQGKVSEEAGLAAAEAYQLAAEEEIRFAQQQAALEKFRDLADLVGALGGLFEAMGISAESGLAKVTTGLQAAISGATDLAATLADPGASLMDKIGAGVRAAGAVVSLGRALFDAFSSSPAEKAAKEAGRVLGMEVSEEMGQAIVDEAERLGISVSDAILLNLSDALEATGRTVASFSTEISTLMQRVADGTIPAKEGIAEIGTVFQQAEEEGGAAMLAMIQQARELGLEIPEIQAHVAEALGVAVEGLKLFVAGIAELDGEFGRMGENSATVFMATFNALVEEQGWVEATRALQDTYATLRDKLKEIGDDAALALLAPFERFSGYLENEVLAGALDAVSGLTQVMHGMADAGYLDADAFRAMQQTAADLFLHMTEGGMDTKDALLALAPTIQEAINTAENFGVPLDEDMQRLKDMAEQNGITFRTDPMQQMVDLLAELVRVMGGDLPESFERSRQAGQAAFEDVADHVRYLDELEVHIPVHYDQGNFPDGPNGSPPEPAQRGALVMPRPGGKTFTVGEGGQTEVIAPVAAMLEHIGRGLASQMGQGGGGGGTVHVHVDLNGRELGHAITEWTRTGWVQVHNNAIVSKP